MMCRLRCAAAVVLALGSISDASAQQVFTQEELAQAGITRPADLFRLAFGWVASSPDGYAWDATVLGSAPEHEPLWMLFVDGVPLDLRALGRSNLNMLPVPVPEICEVAFYRQPVQIGAVLAPSGAIDVRTCTPPQGFAASAVVSAGGETGDPGPFRYVQDEAPNVDRTGPATHSAVSWGQAGGHVRLTGQVDEYHSTDPLIRPRVHTLYRGEKDARIHHRAAGLHIGSRGRRGSIHGWAAFARLEDLRFSEAVGLEVPANHEVLLGHVAGHLARPKVHLSLSTRRSRLVTRPNPMGISVDWDQVAAELAVHKTLGSALAIGAQSSLARTTGYGMSGHRVLWLQSGFASVNSTPHAPMQLGASLHLTLDNGRLGGQVLATAHSRPHGLTLTVHVARRSPAAVQGLLYWRGAGYRPGGLKQAAVPNQPDAITTASADLAWQGGRRMKLTLTGGLRRHQDLPVSRFRLDYDSLTFGVSTRDAHAVVAGTAAVASGQLDIQADGRVRVGAHARYAHVLAGGDSYATAWRSRGLLQVHMLFAPNSRFSLFGKVRYQGSARWADYDLVAASAPGRYVSTIPSALYGSLTIHKRFWRQRLRVSASLHNLLNRPYRSHPGGAATGLAFDVQIQLRLGSSPTP